MMLAAFALGFNAMWKTGGAAYDDVLKQALDLDAGDAIVGFLYIGTDAARPAIRAARPWADLVSYWGETT
jgi:nitroreductase